MKPHILFVFVGALAFGAACSDGSGGAETDPADTGEQQTGEVPEELVPFDTSGTFYQNAALGLTITEFAEWGDPAGGAFERREDGSIELVGEALVSVEGLGERYVTAAVFEEPVATGSRVIAVTVDSETGKEHNFYYDPDEAAIVLGNEAGGVYVFKEADGSYGVVTALDEQTPDEADVQVVQTGYEAWQLIQDYNQYDEVSGYGLLLAYALAQDVRRPILAIQVCEEPYGCSQAKAPGKADDGRLVAANKTPVCTTFAAFCDCVACQAAGRGESCELCQAPN